MHSVFCILAPTPAAYPWSSYHWYLNPRDAPEWLDWRTILAEFGGTEAAARIAYRRYVEQGLTTSLENPLAQVYAGVLLGTEPFIERHRHLVDDRHADPCVSKRRITLPEITAAVVTTFQIPPESLTISVRHGNAPRDAANRVNAASLRFGFPVAERQGYTAACQSSVCWCESHRGSRQ